jgi:hypothetical protein
MLTPTRADPATDEQAAAVLAVSPAVLGLKGGRVHDQHVIGTKIRTVAGAQRAVASGTVPRRQTGVDDAVLGYLSNCQLYPLPVKLVLVLTMQRVVQG